MNMPLLLLMLISSVVNFSNQVPQDLYQKENYFAAIEDEFGDLCPKCQQDLAALINRLEEKIDAREDQLRTQLDKVVTSLENLMTSIVQANDNVSVISAEESYKSFPFMMVKAMESLVNKLDGNRDKPLKVILTKESIPERCPAPFELEGGSCLHFVLEGHTWTRAKDNCEALAPGASLVMPTTESKIKDFENFIKNKGITAPTGYVWLGAEEDKSDRGNWYWLDKTKVNFQSSLTWKKGEPNEYIYSYREDCLDYNLNHIGLNDDNCQHELSSICQVPKH